MVEKQPKVGEWIPCTERLPEEAGFYIVTKRQKSGDLADAEEIKKRWKEYMEELYKKDLNEPD